ncbi:MAG: hypothetical protein WDW38_003611 [Sanguina aurantia]
MSIVLADQVALRLRRLQALVTDVGVGGLLLISGQDGGFNAGATQVLGYLLQGESSRDALELTQLSDPWGDCMLFIQPHALSAYVTTAGACDELRRLTIRHASNVRIFCPEMDESDDPDGFEEFKLGALVAMLRGCDSVGIPHATPLQEGWSVTATAAAAAALGFPVLMIADQLMGVERWPLLQAYGLDGVGRPGFFTMNFKVWDVNSTIQRVYASLDGRAVQALVSQHCSSLRQQWLETLRDITMPPRVAFGVHTNVDGSASSASSLQELSARGSPAEHLAAPGSHGLGGGGAGRPASSPLHMVVEGADPRSALRVARSYFLSAGALVRDAFADAEAEQEEGYSYDSTTRGWACDDAVQLMRTYLALVEGSQRRDEPLCADGEQQQQWQRGAIVAQRLPHLPTAHAPHNSRRERSSRVTHVPPPTQEGAAAGGAEAVALDTLTGCCGRLGLPPPASSTPSRGSSGRLAVSLWQCDHANRVTGVARRGSRQLKVVRLSLLDIHSSSHNGALLGGLVYADTFLDIPASASSSVLPARQAALLNLTAAIPALVAWPVFGCEAAVHARAEKSLAGVAAMGAGDGGGGATSAGAAAAERRRSSARAAAARAVESAAAAARAALIAAGATDADAAADEIDAPGHVSESEEAEDVPPVGRVAWRPLGPQLTFGGGDECVLLSASPLLAAVPGAITCFSSGFVFVAAHSGAMWVCEFSAALERIVVQELQGPKGAPSLGEAIVFRGRSPACGFSPACHLTTGVHLALPLAAMSQGVQRHLMRAVLPAWKSACTDGERHAHEEGETSHAVVEYRKDPTAPNPFPPALHAAHAHAAALLQPLQPGGTRKVWEEVQLPDAEVEELLTRLDCVELRTSLAASDPSLDAMLANSSANLPATASTTAITAPSAATPPATATAVLSLVCGLPGADHALVAETLMGMSESPSDSRIVWLQCPTGPPPGPRASMPAVPAVGPKASPPAASPGPLLLSQSDVNSALDAALAHTTAGDTTTTPSSTAPLSPSPGGAGAAVPGREPSGDERAGGAGRGVGVRGADGGVWEDADRGALLPGLAEGCSEGLVDVVVMRGAAAEVAAVQPLLAARNPSALLIRATHASLSRARDDIMPLRLITAPTAERLQRRQAAAAARQLWISLPSPSATQRMAPQLQRGPLQAVHITFAGLLDLGRLRYAMQVT